MQGNDRSAPPSGLAGRIAIGRNEVETGKNGAHDFPLHSNAAAVDDAQGFKAEPVRLVQIFLHCSLDVRRRNAVQIEGIGDLDAPVLLVHFPHTKNEKPGEPEAAGHSL
jgi:hypothetical protein